MKQVLPFLIVVYSLVAKSQSVWTQRASLPDQPRWGSTCFSIQDVAYMVGGNNGAVDLSELWAYSANSNTWTQLSPIPGNRRTSTGFSILGKGYVFGGLLGTSTQLNDLWEYDPVTDQWSQKTSLPSSGRYGSAGFVVNGKGFIAVGNTGSGTGPYVSELWEYDPTTDQWAIKAPLPAQTRYGSSAFVLNDVAYLFGGRNNDQTLSNELWSYDHVLDIWTSRASLPATGRVYPMTWMTDGYGIVAAGNIAPGLVGVDCWAYDPSLDTWISLPDYTGAGGWTNSFFSADGRVFGGLGQTSNTPFNDLWELEGLTLGDNDVQLLSPGSVHPNPCASGGTIEIGLRPGLDETVSISIYNALGEAMFSSDYGPKNKIRFQLPDLESAWYLCSMNVRGKIVGRVPLIVVDR